MKNTGSTLVKYEKPTVKAERISDIVKSTPGGVSTDVALQPGDPLQGGIS